MSTRNTPSTQRTLWRLFLTLFLRGRSARSLQKATAPRSVFTKLWTTLGIYFLIGAFALVFTDQPVFALSVYLHAATLVLLGMFVSVSAGEILFNSDEADILMHRPVSSRELLWAKIGVLVQVSLWMAGAFNLIGLIVGARGDGGWLFVPVHLLSTALSALFCTGCVVLIYQLCLRWFGRERLDGLMTTAQVVVSVAVVLGSQVVPRFIGQFGGTKGLGGVPWWVRLLPPAWFAGIDDALIGSRAASSWMLAAAGLGITAIVLALAFGKLAGDYEAGVRALSERSSARPSRAGRRWLDVIVRQPPLSWWLRDSTARASFLLTAAYLFRDRETKLRIYPGVAPMLVMPFVFMTGGLHRSGGGDFAIAFSGVYLGMVPLVALDLVRFSQQWPAADLFRIVPMRGPAQLCHGARRAVLVMLTLPMIVLFTILVWALGGGGERLALLLPGVIALPVYAMIPCMGGKAVPFSHPVDAAKSSRRGVTMMGVMLASALLAGIMSWAWGSGWFAGLLLLETVVASALYVSMRILLSRARWASID